MRLEKNSRFRRIKSFLKPMKSMLRRMKGFLRLMKFYIEKLKKIEKGISFMQFFHFTAGSRYNDSTLKFFADSNY